MICIEIGGPTLIELIKAILVHSIACLDISRTFDTPIQVKAIKLQPSLQSKFLFEHLNLRVFILEALPVRRKNVSQSWSLENTIVLCAKFLYLWLIAMSWNRFLTFLFHKLVIIRLVVLTSHLHWHFVHSRVHDFEHRLFQVAWSLRFCRLCHTCILVAKIVLRLVIDLYLTLFAIDSFEICFHSQVVVYVVNWRRSLVVLCEVVGVPCRSIVGRSIGVALCGS